MRVGHRLPVIGLVIALAGLSAAQGQEQPIRIIFPFAAGGSGDALARLVADKMRTALNRPVVVEDRAGGAGRPAVAAVKNAAPDGNTLLFTPIAPMVFYQHVYTKLDYDPIVDFAAVSQLATFDFAVAVGPQAPANSLRELVAWVKTDPARAAFGSPGAGTLPHFLGLMFGRAAGLDLRHIPYKGSAATLTDLTAGHVPMVFTTLSDLVEMHKARRIRILATSGTKRSRFLPDTPTFRESGFDIQANAWYGVFAPAKTPSDTLDRLSAIMAAAVRSPELRDRLFALGLEPTGSSPGELASVQRADSDRWGPVVKASGFAAD